MARELYRGVGPDEIDSTESDAEAQGAPGARARSSRSPIAYAGLAIAGVVGASVLYFSSGGGGGGGSTRAIAAMDAPDLPTVGGATTEPDGYIGSPGSSGPLEDLDAWYSAKRTAILQADRRSGSQLAWVPIGSHQVVVNEGASVGSSEGVKGFDDCKKACDKEPKCHSFTLCGPDCYMKDRVLTGSEATQHNSYCASYLQSADTYRPTNKALLQPSEAPALTYYVYRAQSPATPGGDYPMENVNVASIGGVMWYLHDEVIRDCWFNGQAGQRRFGISRIRRFKITTKATKPLHEIGMNYGLKCSFDSGVCTGPHKDHVEGRGTGWHSLWQWDHYGFYVGCDILGQWPHNERVFQSGTRYPDAVWYSLPGACPTMDYRSASDDCKVSLPGGMCDQPDGRGNCTYKIEDAGEIDIDELVGITPRWKDRADFCRSGGFEGNGATGAWGHNLRFWDNIWDERKDHERTQKALEMFRKKYPNMPSDEVMKAPKCDTNAQKFLAA